MDDKLYLIDISNAAFSEEFNNFFTDFISKHRVAILTSACANQLPTNWLAMAKYVFASDGHECYIDSKLVYKNILMPSRELLAWVNSKQLAVTKCINYIKITSDPYTSASLVREFNSMFGEYRAYSCSDGFKIGTLRNTRSTLAALISSSYALVFITPTGLLGYANAELANSVMKRGACYHATNELEIKQLLLSLLEK